MNRRPLRTTSLLLALLVGAGIAAAGVSAQGNATDENRTDESAPSFALKADPAEVRVKAGTRGLLKVFAVADGPTRLGLALVDPPRFPVKLSPEHMAVRPGTRSVAEVGFFVPEDFPAGTYRFGVSATSGSGEAHGVRLSVHVVADESLPRPAERPSERPAEPDADRPTDRSRPASDAAFRFAAEPTERRTRGGERLEFVLHASARENLTLSLRTGELPRGYVAHFASETLEIHAGEPARTRLVLAVAEGAQSARIPVHAIAQDGQGRAQVVLAIHTPEQAREEPAPTREPTRGSERDADAKAPGGFGMLLIPLRIAVGPDGARVPLLFQGGSEDVVVKLATRHDEESGWTVGLQSDEVKLRAHARTWIWVQLVPGEDADRTLKYAILGTDGETQARAVGAAGLRYARTA